MLIDFYILDGLYYLVGYVFSILVGAWATSGIVLIYYTGYQEAITKHRWRVNMLGMVERALYTTSWLAGFPEFVAIWLALKVAGHWERWKRDIGDANSEGVSKARQQDVARATYTGYLLGNALSISFGIAGGNISEHLIAGRLGAAIAIAASLLVACGFLYLYIRRKVSGMTEDGEEEESDAT